MRFALETFRSDNWTFFGIPTAQIVSIMFIVPALLILAWRHRPNHPLDDPPSRPAGATWGAVGRPVDPDEIDPEAIDPDDPDGEARGGDVDPEPDPALT